MKKSLLLAITHFYCCILLNAQTKQYLYYFDAQMRPASKDNAAITGKGMRQDSLFLVKFYATKDNRLLALETYKDSSLNILQGHRITYHPNMKAAERSSFNNNFLHGTTVKWDSMGRKTDSTVFWEDMPVYHKQYAYTNHTPQVKHLFTNKWARMPDEKATVITHTGEILTYDIWRNLLYGGKVGFKKDEIDDNTFLIVRYSDNYFEQIVAKDTKPKESEFFKTGQPFTINEKDINGNKLKSKELIGKVLVINYWFINCKPCRMEMPDLNELVDAYKDSANVKFIAIGLDDKASIKDFLRQLPFKYQIVSDGRYLSERYGVKAYPTHVIVDGEGKVYFHTVSSPRQLVYWMKKTINELLEKQRALTPAVTKS